jgi:molybdopterin-containing oxidoreductase family membrane subunit
VAFTLSAAFLALYIFSIVWTVWKGIGEWGANRTINWAYDITNFVWWIGIGHAGTLISAILLLFRQRWRTGVNRAAEAMTIFAVICAGQFPIFHMGRVRLAFFIFPFPNTRGPLWTNFNSPLLCGRIRDFDLFFGFASVSGTRVLFLTLPQFATAQPASAAGCTNGLLSAGRAVPSTGSAGKHFHWCSPVSQLRWYSTVQHAIVSVDFATSVIPEDGTQPYLPALFRCRWQFLWFQPWCRR